MGVWSFFDWGGGGGECGCPKVLRNRCRQNNMLVKVNFNWQNACINTNVKCNRYIRVHGILVTFVCGLPIVSTTISFHTSLFLKMGSCYCTKLGGSRSQVHWARWDPIRKGPSKIIFWSSFQKRYSMFKVKNKRAIVKKSLRDKIPRKPSSSTFLAAVRATTAIMRCGFTASPFSSHNQKRIFFSPLSLLLSALSVFQWPFVVAKFS